MAETVKEKRQELVEEDVTDAIKLFSSHKHDKHVEPSHDELKLKREEPTIIQDESDEERMVRLVKITQQDFYPDIAQSRGVCLIFENDMFHTSLGLSKRKGSEVDRALITNVFTHLQFEVRVYQNFTAGDIKKTLDKARFEDHSKHDMFSVVILSHGNEGILYAYDKYYRTEEIWEPFTAENCETLAGKPKLFFLQACQGNKLDHGVKVQGSVQTDGGGFASYRTPLHADFLLAHSTVSGYYSWRNTVQGSWFIQVLGCALLTNYKTQDLVTILTKVSRVVGREYESNSSQKEFNRKKQIPFIYSTLTAKLYLKPKP